MYLLIFFQLLNFQQAIQCCTPIRCDPEQHSGWRFVVFRHSELVSESHSPVPSTFNLFPAIEFSTNNSMLHAYQVRPWTEFRVTLCSVSSCWTCFSIALACHLCWFLSCCLYWTSNKQFNVACLSGATLNWIQGDALVCFVMLNLFQHRTRFPCTAC